MYKIRQISTGLYQTGGRDNWTKHGKSWAATGHLRLHLAHVRSEYSWYDNNWKAKLAKEIEDWEVIEFTMESGIVKRWKVLDFYPAMLQKP